MENVLVEYETPSDILGLLLLPWSRNLMMSVRKRSLPKILSFTGILIVVVVLLAFTKSRILGYDNLMITLDAGIALTVSGILWFLVARELRRPDPIEEKIKMLSAEQRLELSKKVFTYTSLIFYIVALGGISTLYQHSSFLTEQSQASSAPTDVKISLIMLKTATALVGATLLLWKASKVGAILLYAAWGFLMLDFAFVQTYAGSIMSFLYYLVPGAFLTPLYRFRKYLR